MAAYDEIPSFSHDKFEAALEQSRLLPMPTKDLLARIQEAVRSKIPFTVGGCQNVIAYLRSLAQEIVDGQMFDTSPAVGPLRTQLTKAGEGGVFAGKFSKWKEGREAVREVKGMLAEIAKPFTKYAVEWENSKRGRLRKFGRRMESDGGFFQGHWDTETGLRSGSGVQVGFGCGFVHWFVGRSNLIVRHGCRLMGMGRTSKERFCTTNHLEPRACYVFPTGRALKEQ